MFNDRKEALLHNWRKAIKTGRIEEINEVCENIRRFALDIQWDATVPEETKEQVNFLLEIMEGFVKTRNFNEISVRYS